MTTCRRSAIVPVKPSGNTWPAAAGSPAHAVPPLRATAAAPPRSPIALSIARRDIPDRRMASGTIGARGPAPAALDSFAIDESSWGAGRFIVQPSRRAQTSRGSGHEAVEEDPGGVLGETRRRVGLGRLVPSRAEEDGIAQEAMEDPRVHVGSEGSGPDAVIDRLGPGPVDLFGQAIDDGVR